MATRWNRFVAGPGRATAVARLAGFLLVIGTLVTDVPAAGAAWKTAVIGDSLSREYALEFPVLFPDNPASWDARNWVEILHDRRRDVFAFGGDDPPFERNDAIPGYEAAQWRDDLDDSDGWIPAEVIVRAIVNEDVDDAELAVVFLGGNDLNSAYGGIYNGDDASGWIDRMTTDLAFIVDYILARNGSIPVVLVNVPHLGIAPDIQADYPTDPVNTGRVTDTLLALDDRLRAVAGSRGIAFADVLTPTLDMLAGDALCVGGIEIDPGADPDARPRYLFSGDGFHPNTVGHVFFANAIIDAVITAGVGPVATLPSRETLDQVLGIDPDLPYREWIAGFAVAAAEPGDDPDLDGLTNYAEFALDLDPGRPDRHRIPAGMDAVAGPDGDSIRILVDPRVETCRSFRMTADPAPAPVTTPPGEPGTVEELPDRTVEILLPAGGERGFTRIGIAPVP